MERWVHLAERGRPLDELLSCPSRGEIGFGLSRDDRVGKRFCCLDFGWECLMLECELMMSKRSLRVSAVACL